MFEKIYKNVINDLIDIVFVYKGFEVLSNVLKEVISESIDKNVTNAMNDQKTDEKLQTTLRVKHEQPYIAR